VFGLNLFLFMLNVPQICPPCSAEFVILRKNNKYEFVIQ
jgi:hypothetical protein